MTKEEIKDRLIRISELAKDDEAIMNELKGLQDDVYNVIDNISTEEVDDSVDENGGKWSERYDDMVRKYRERFFSDEEEVKEEQIEDIRSDNNAYDIEYEDLFKTREGDYNI